jgi:L-lactate dehydrogenase (cytochrome)
MMFDFVDGAAGDESGDRLNRMALQETRLQPRVLVNVEDRTIGKKFLGRSWGLPFGIAPMGMCNLTWPGADQMLAAEAARREIPLCLSSAASTALEEMRTLTGGRTWFQLYVGQSIEAAMEMVDRAASAGYEVLVLTVDVPQVSRRIRDLKNGFQVPFKLGPKQFLDFALHPDGPSRR